MPEAPARAAAPAHGSRRVLVVAGVRIPPGLRQRRASASRTIDALHQALVQLQDEVIELGADPQDDFPQDVKELRMLGVDRAVADGPRGKKQAGVLLGNGELDGKAVRR